MKKLKKPNFLGIGVMRGGTTWLHEQLKTHKEIYLPELKKEIHFFDRNYQKGKGWYKKHFQKKGYKRYGEITPAYISTEKTPERIQETLKDPKFILILRDPVERAHSQYRRSIRYENLDQTFREYIKENKNVFRKGLLHPIKKLVTVLWQKRF